MSAPTRLLESGSDFEAKLLRSAKAEKPSASGMRRAVAAASTVALGTSAGISAKSGLVTATATKVPTWVAALGAAVGIAGVGMAVLAARSTGPVGSPQVDRTAVDAPASSAASAPARRASVAAALPDAPSDAEPARAAPRVMASAAVPAKQRHQAIVASSALAPAPLVEDELTLVRRAKARIAASEPEGALEILDAHAKAFPRGTFGEEAAALRVEALVAKGDGLRARGAAETFFERHPESPYAQRVRSALMKLPR